MSAKTRSPKSDGAGDRILAQPGNVDAYEVRLAAGEADLRAAQRLRYEVFNLELHEGLASAHATGLDMDEFDPVCDHLIVTELATGLLVGTYRLQTGASAARHLGYYSEREFDLAPFEPVRDEMIELGRACVHKAHRNMAVLSQLWRSIASYAQERSCNRFIGCSSLTSQDPAVGAAVYRDFEKHHLAEPRFLTLPRPDVACPLGVVAKTAPKPPKLLAAYLSLGAKICGPPAIDREFGTIDFLTLMDLRSASVRTRELLGFA